MKQKKYKRIFVIVLDSLGIGAMPDSPEYGDIGVDTFGHILEVTGGLEIPNLTKLGMLNLHPAPLASGEKAAAMPEKNAMKAAVRPIGRFMKMAEASHSKDTMAGHWEMMGIQTVKPFKTFTEHGFPPELIRELEARCHKKVIGNRAESGTVILDELGEEEIRDGKMIVYTSADSVLQICGNEQSFDLANLYRCCEIARELTMRDEWKVGRVIARPYVGTKRGEFHRTANRRDYAVAPPEDTALNALSKAGLDVIGIGKIHDIFSGSGLTQTFHSESSVHGMQQTIAIARSEFTGLCFTNLVDFDALWGHRRNPEGYGREIEKFDAGLGELMPVLKQDDLLILTADHGNDPTYSGTDHTREYVPFLAWSPSMPSGGRLPDAETFAVIGASICDNFNVPQPEGNIGTSILEEL